MTYPHYAIFDKNAGFLQWVGEAASAEDALSAFNSDAGIDPHGEGISVDDWHIYRITQDQAKAVSEWWENGAPADAFPLADVHPE